MRRILHPPFHEFTFETARSSGAGGQYVNKTDSAVILRWTPSQTQSLSVNDIERLLRVLSRKLTRDGELLIRSHEFRSQRQNKEACIQKWIQIIEKALKPQVKRIQTKPTRASKAKRLEKKKHHSQIKKLRSRVEED